MKKHLLWIFFIASCLRSETTLKDLEKNSANNAAKFLNAMDFTDVEITCTCPVLNDFCICEVVKNNIRFTLACKEEQTISYIPDMCK